MVHAGDPDGLGQRRGGYRHRMVDIVAELQSPADYRGFEALHQARAHRRRHVPLVQGLQGQRSVARRCRKERIRRRWCCQAHLAKHRGDHRVAGKEVDAGLQGVLVQACGGGGRRQRQDRRLQGVPHRKHGALHLVRHRGADERARGRGSREGAQAALVDVDEQHRVLRLRGPDQEVLNRKRIVDRLCGTQVEVLPEAQGLPCGPVGAGEGTLGCKGEVHLDGHQGPARGQQQKESGHLGGPPQARLQDLPADFRQGCDRGRVGRHGCRRRGVHGNDAEGEKWWL
mmetsp:Transcript_22954/g.66415  ORF Transcript_22954/g.66415 Transcript_22954/m.66415 type:complete len:285 (+) Transcript_22954:2463-3317(+)